ncbi:uncharacterized protein CC84DRAFT_1262731 [Paraphaeosphaeria sporulosa]|uniref:Uncharacterized protein n=1 Tax=Paraphaeosphaeria sporulosa TaxID=1460663 RepID=A0A177C2N9_9PLEO|nr:uncharacterized protein CC84DRAFT_1262731 [Paraphaeosphaeria sporulosa]OAG01706.1 hypothetical protein CC84DRAFT_1262731 [Paraphaeosphaeria sporulosa]
MNRPTAPRGRGLPRSRGMIFNTSPNPELSRRSTAGTPHSLRSSRKWSDRRSSRTPGLALPQPNSRQELSRDATWQTVSWSSEPPLELPTLDSELQDWCTKILEYLECESLEISPPSEDTTDIQSRETSWVTEAESSLPHLDILNWIEQQPPTRSLSLSGKGVKQQRRNATVFALPKVSLANPRASSAEYTCQTSTLFGSSREIFQIQSNNTSAPETSGEYHESPDTIGSHRIAPYHHPETVRILEGKGPFLLDARDISLSQFRGRRGDSDDTITLGSSEQLQSMLRRNRVDGNAAEGQVHPWSSGVFNKCADEIVTSLRNIQGAAAAGRSEGQPLPGVIKGAAAGANEEQVSPVVIEGATAAGDREDKPSPEEIEDNIISLLETMGTVGKNSRRRGQEKLASPGCARPAPHIESAGSGDRSSSVASPLPSLSIVDPTGTGSKQKRFGKLGRWWKGILKR